MFKFNVSFKSREIYEFNKLTEKYKIGGFRQFSPPKSAVNGGEKISIGKYSDKLSKTAINFIVASKLKKI